MAPTDSDYNLRDWPTDQQVASDRTARARRIAVFVVVVAALLVTVWALIEGGDRDLWSQPSALAAAVVAAPIQL